MFFRSSMKNESPTCDDELPTATKLAMKGAFLICKTFCHLIFAVLFVFPVSLSIYFAIYLGQYLTGTIHRQSFSVEGLGPDIVFTYPIIQALLQQTANLWNTTQAAIPILPQL